MKLAHALAATAALVVAGCGGEGIPASRPASDTGRGLAVWTAQGCGSCHTLKAAGSSADIGPSLDTALEGATPEEIKESIVAPDLKADPGTSAGMMPTDYAKRIKPADLDALVSFIASSSPVGASAASARSAASRIAAPAAPRRL